MLFMETLRTSVQDTTYAAVEILFEYESFAELAEPDYVAVSVMSVFRSQTIMLKVRDRC